MTMSTDSLQTRDPGGRWAPRVRHAGMLSGLVVALVAGFHSVADADIPERYPYDPVCPWGRVADGNGMMVRCLESGEAKSLLQMQGSVKPAESTAPAGPSVPPVASEPAAAKPSTVSGKVVVESVGPAVADAGDLPLAGSKLSSAKDKYVQCVAQNGGLSAKQGKVVVRFLVRERGRAEGVSVKSHSGISAAAAQCIAEVVNLRYVGYPAAPIVGATIPILLSTQP